MVTLALQPRGSVARIAREHDINDNLLFKWLRLWQNEGRISRRLPVTTSSDTGVELLPVEITPDEPKEPAAKSPARRDDGETRSFYFPSSTVNMEKELLRKYRVDDFQGLLEEVHTLLVGLVKLMQSVHKDVRVRGYVISSLGAQLDHASALVLRMRNVYDRVMPIQR